MLSHLAISVVKCFISVVWAFSNITGIGAAMSLNMRIIPNPGDGIVQAIADFVHKGVGITKNCFDICNVLFTCCIGLIFTGHLVGNRRE